MANTYSSGPGTPKYQGVTIYTPGTEPTVSVYPPTGQSPNAIQLGGWGTATPQSDGSFIVPSAMLAQLMAGGFTIKTGSGTHVP